MDYNSKRKKLVLPEYGRNMQNIVDYIITIQDRDERNRAAKTAVDIMGNLYPYLRDVAEFNYKLWDHLAIMADFKLDIDYPYEHISPNILNEKPNKIPYAQFPIKYRHYGLIMERMINKIPEYEGEEKEILIQQLANHMKKSYLVWNKGAVEDEKIFSDLEELSGEKIELNPAFKLTETKNILGNNNNNNKNKNKSKNKKNNKNKSGKIKNL
ncbi:MAG: DUF4290 domain-containing protein [Bacteroidales bacterium]|jgi:hypothetical protein|nr:DUF4290 domain-containing protein [Bacteroidales bacterium]